MLLVVVLLFGLALSPAMGLQIAVKSTNGTENIGSGFTDKQLAIQRWFAHLTFTSNGSWVDYATENMDQLDLTSYRYALAFMAYAASAMNYAKTPAYTELNTRILADAFERMINQRVWAYWDTPRDCVSPFDIICNFANTSYCHVNDKADTWCPDPVHFENIMYSGHLMQMGALLEAVSGNTSLTDEGWDFVAEKASIRYTLPLLMDRITAQVMSDRAGGVACEPTFVYAICNNHPRAAFALFDAIHASNYRNVAFMFGSKNEVVLETTDEPVWLDPFGVGGCATSDGWQLAWMSSWLDNTTSGFSSMTKPAMDALANSKGWRHDPATNGWYIEENALYTGSGYNFELATSFYPVAERIYAGQPGEFNRANETFVFFEGNYGTATDVDGDGSVDAYFYNSSLTQRIWTTANLALAMIVEPDTLSSLFGLRGRPFNHTAPQLVHVDYPGVMVRSAVFNATSSTLLFTLLSSSGQPLNTTVSCIGLGSNVSVTLDGSPYDDWSTTGSGSIQIAVALAERDAIFAVQSQE